MVLALKFLHSSSVNQCPKLSWGSFLSPQSSVSSYQGCSHSPLSPGQLGVRAHLVRGLPGAQFLPEERPDQRDPYRNPVPLPVLDGSECSWVSSNPAGLPQVCNPLLVLGEHQERFWFQFFYRWNIYYVEQSLGFYASNQKWDEMFHTVLLGFLYGFNVYSQSFSSSVIVLVVVFKKIYFSQ